MPSLSGPRATLAILACCAFVMAVSPQPVSAQLVSPVVGADRKVTFRLRAPNAKDVKVDGDWTRKPVVMAKDDTGIWTYITEPLEPDLYGYFFVVDGTNIADPANTLMRVGTRNIKSQLEVPGDKADFLAIRNVPHGALHEHWYFAPALKATRRVIVYTPPGYSATAAETYPVLYLLHGSGDDETYWSRVGRANFIMDNLLAAKKARPALIVMPFGHVSREAGAGRVKGGGPGGGSGFMEKDLFENVMPLVEREYRAGKEAHQRAIAGLSMGGNQALTIGLNNLTRIAYVAGMSSAGTGAKAGGTFSTLLADPGKSNKELKLLWIGCGEQDSLFAGNQSFDKLLTSRGIRHEWIATPEYGHVWTLWRVYLRDLLPKLFND
jgi:enterochelin esterase-like enzyme